MRGRRGAREKSTTKCAMRSRVTEAKSLVTWVVTLQPLYKLKNAQHLHWWREYNVSPGARKPSFSPQPQWPLTTCCLSIYILDVVRTSSPYISSRARGRDLFLCKSAVNCFCVVRFAAVSFYPAIIIWIVILLLAWRYRRAINDDMCYIFLRE